SLWDTALGTKVRGHLARGRLVWTREGQVLVYAPADNIIAFWDVSTGKERSVTLKDHTEGLRVGDISPDGSVLVTHAKNRVQWWDADTGKLLSVSDPQDRDVDYLAFNPYGKGLASKGVYGADVSLWQAGAGQKAGSAKPVTVL